VLPNLTAASAKPKFGGVLNPTANKNCEEALNLFLEEPIDSKIIFPLPNNLLDGENDILNTHRLKAVGVYFYV
jgi:hypothetical protein